MGAVEAESLRRLSVLFDGLPSEASVWREEMRWTVRDELAAAQLEAIDALTRIVIQLATGKSAGGKPLRVKRPTDEEEAVPKRKRSSEVVSSFMRGVK